MYEGFPPEMLHLLRCPNDGGRLRFADMATVSTDKRVEQGTVGCDSCASTWPVRNGILCLYNPDEAHSEGEHERVLRDRSRPEGTTPLEVAPPSTTDLSEINPTLAGLEPLEGTTLLELGTGAGRFTVFLTPRCRQILAVDFSFAALRHTARKLKADAQVALVQADITRFAAAPGAFDRVLSTLTSNLPTREHRLHMYRVASEALNDGGCFVSTTHHSSLISRIYGVRPAWRYAEGDIFRYCMTRDEIRDEAAPYFRRRTVSSIRVYLPVASRLGLLPPSVSVLAGRIPGLRAFGRQLLSKLEKPARPNTYGVVPQVPRLLRGIQARYLQRSGPDGW
jgi:SAM-dependent methyltransferase